MTASLNRIVEVQQSWTTWVELLRYRSHHQPNQTAFTVLQNGEIEAGKLTYQELDQQAQAIAATLQTFAQPGDRALLLYPSGLEFIAAFFGCLYAGVVAVPAYPPRPNQNLLRLKAIVADADAAIALTTQTLLADLKQRWAKDEQHSTLQWLATNILEPCSTWQEPAITGDSLAFLQYTSGSTGQPKGVMVSHRNLLHNEQMIQQAFGHRSHTISVGWLPLFHDMGLVGNVLQPLYLGLPCTLMSPVDFLQKPFRWLSAISRCRATSSGGPNFAYDLCVRRITPEQLQQLDLSCWEVAFTGAEPIRAETLERFAETFAPCGFRPEAFYPCYGMAEATLFITGGLPTAFPKIQSVEAEALTQNQVILAPSPHKIVSCGQVWGNQTVKIVNPLTLTPCDSAEVGEIWVMGESITQGYWNKPEQTKSTFHAYTATNAGPFLRTGDLGFLLDGELFVTGRVKDMIIIRGRNYYPQDIEATVEQCHPGIRRPGCVAAFSVEIAGAEQLVVIAEVERRYRDRLDSTEIIAQIRQAIATHHQLQVYATCLLQTGSIPKTSSGKIQRHACRIGFLTGTLKSLTAWTLEGSNTTKKTLNTMSLKELLTKSPLQQQSLIQDWLIDQIALHLKVNPQLISAIEPLSKFGLDSIQTVSLAAELEEWLECHLPATFLEGDLSIAQLSQALIVNHLGHSSTVSSTQSTTASRAIWSIAQPLYKHWFQLQASGLDHLPQDRPYLLAANHSSHLDLGAVAISLLGHVDHLACLGAKDYFFKNSLQSWFFRTAFNVLPFDRVGHFLEALHECQQVLAPRCPILMFPEGTRSRTGELQAFQAGLGFLALHLEVPIVPVYIAGAYQALPKGQWQLQRHPISVTFGATIEVAPCSSITAQQCSKLSEEVHSAILQLQQH